MLSAPAWWRAAPTAARWLLAAVVVTELGSGLTWPFTLIYLHEARGLPLAQVGTVLAAPAVVALLVMGPAGVLVDRFGALPVVVAGLVLQVTAALLMASATTFSTAMVASLVNGAAQAGVGPAFSTLVVQVVPPALRQRYFAARFTAVNVGAGLGPVIGGFVVEPHRPATFAAVFVADAVTFLAPLAVVLGPIRRLLARGPVTAPVTQQATADSCDVPGPTATAAPADRADAGGREDTGSYRSLLADPAQRPLLLLVVVASLIGFGQLDSGIPALARSLGDVPTRVIGWGFGLECAVVAVLQLLVVERLEGRRRTRVLVCAAALWGSCFILLGLSGLSPGTVVAVTLFLVCLVAFALGEALYVAPLMAMINDLAPDHLRGRANSLAGLAGQIGYGAGPLLAGTLLGQGRPLTLVTVLVVGAALVVALSRFVEPRLAPTVNGVVTTTAGAGEAAARSSVTSG